MSRDSNITRTNEELTAVIRNVKSFLEQHRRFLINSLPSIDKATESARELSASIQDATKFWKKIFSWKGLLFLGGSYLITYIGYRIIKLSCDIIEKKVTRESECFQEPSVQ